MKSRITGVVFALLAATGFAPAAPSVLPAARKMVVAGGTFMLTPDTRICADVASRTNADFLAAQLRQATGFRFSVSAVTQAGPVSGAILLTTVDADTSLGGASYALSVAGEFVVIRAREQAGSFYGVQTLLQLLPSEIFASKPVRDVHWTIPCVQIADAPRFDWRGLMLDCSRTFQSLEYLRQTIDRMAVYKLNVLHLHLTDDQGWRLEIKKYPELTAKGGFFPAKYNEPASHQGFYTQEQMKDLVAYAAARHITIVPEIELPGHSLAALSVLPHLSCTGGPFEIYPFFKGPGITPDIFCAGQEETFEFFSNVLAEVIDIFPSKYIHIGGDEAPKARWKACPACQKCIKDEGLKNEAELQSWFIRRAERMVAAKGRRLIGWDEIAEGGLSPNAAVMWWRAKSGQSGTEIVKSALQNGHETVMSPNTYCYFDYTYQRTDTLRAYSFEPIPPELDAAQAGLVLGLQACFWSHIDREPDQVDYQLFPRLLAIAERGWSPKDTRDPADFSRRITAHAATLKQLGVRYRSESTPTWGPAQVTQDFRPLEWNVTDLTRGPGSYDVVFAFRGGRHWLAIRSVELLANGKVVASEQRDGVAGSINASNTYRLNIPPAVPGTAYTLRAEVRAEGGTDSNGEILIRRI